MISTLVTDDWKTDAFTKGFKGTDSTAFFASKLKWLLIIQFLVDQDVKRLMPTFKGYSVKKKKGNRKIC